MRACCGREGGRGAGADVRESGGVGSGVGEGTRGIKVLGEGHRLPTLCNICGWRRALCHHRPPPDAGVSSVPSAPPTLVPKALDVVTALQCRPMEPYVLQVAAYNTGKSVGRRSSGNEIIQLSSGAELPDVHGDFNSPGSVVVRSSGFIELHHGIGARPSPPPPSGRYL
ncbi:hypothetical protein E2C01_042891 [Portunus trituberculatus]|uniref:Uncharacterized protein n=1 Tax=Portunus trituberculatus TaxID=210409 RepID=A0A5B7FU74_PORTR|nr:hypothetical protein [Portunus trituberculatus]